MAGLLDMLFGGGQQVNPQYSWQPPEQQQPQGLLGGLFGNLNNNRGAMTGYLSGALMPGSVNEQIARGLAGMNAGAQNDILQATRMDALKQKREQEGAAGALIDKQAGLTNEQKRFFATNPEAWKAYSGAMVSPTMQIAPDGSIIQSGAFGKLNIPGGVPISEKSDTINPDGSSSPAFAVKPSLTNPSGGLVRTPMVGGAGGGGMPEMPGMGGPITKQSPQAIEEGQKVGQGLGDDYTTIQKASSSATAAIPTLRRLGQLNLDPTLPQGKLAPALQSFRSALTTFGIDPKSVRAGEEFNTLHNKLILDMQPNGSLGTGFSNADRDYMDALAPSVNNSKEGRTALIDAGLKINQRKQEMGKLATNWRRSTGSMDGFQNFAAQWGEQNPLFPAPTVADRFGGLPSGQAAPAKPGDPGYKVLPSSRQTDSDPLAQARAAIAAGAPRDAVMQRLRQNNIDPSGL